MPITRLTGGLTPADGSDPRTFPTIFNDAADRIEQNDSDIDALDTRVDNLTTDDVAEGTALYYTDTRVETVISNSTTDDLAEGTTNLYYTDARAEAAADGQIAAATTDNLSEGTTNLYYTDGRVETVIAGSTTDDLAEGAGNLYYTDARASAAAPVQSVNTQTGAVSLGAADVGAYPDTNPDSFVNAAGAAAAAPVQSVNTQTGTVVLDASDVGALAGTAIFEDLADVEFTSLADGQTVAFDATAGKWVNAAPGAITAGDIAALNLRWQDI
jgi:hypothetical protein